MLGADLGHKAGGRILNGAAGILTIAFMGSGLLAMWLLSPRVPYADGWRFLAAFLESPFPANVLAADNGHREVFPNLVRVLELHAFDASQLLQIAIGAAFAIGTVWSCWCSIRRMPDAQKRMAALLAVVLGVFWLGNVRALAHGNESVHAYSITLLLVLGLQALTVASDAVTVGQSCRAALCGIAATLCFGSGIACFAAFAVVLALRRSGLGSWLPMVAGLLVAWLLLRWGGDGSGMPALMPAQQLSMWLRWLAGPFVYATWPLVDPAVASHLPLAVVREPMVAMAAGYEATFGPVFLARWPHWLVAAAGLAWFVRLCAIAWRRQADAVLLLGIGIACFSLAIGAMIACVRYGYFLSYPDQLLAPRYVVWSSLFWSGLLLASVAGTRHPRRVLAVAGMVGVLLLPSQAWMGKLGASMRVVAETTALAATVGVIDPELELGETRIEDLERALPIARSAGVANFAWSESKWLGKVLPERAAVQPLMAPEVSVLRNRLAGRAPGRRVAFETDLADCDVVLLVDHDGVVRGLAQDSTWWGGGRWLGWMQGRGGDDPVSVACAPGLPSAG